MWALIGVGIVVLAGVVFKRAFVDYYKSAIR